MVRVIFMPLIDTFFYKLQEVNNCQTQAYLTINYSFAQSIEKKR